MISSSKGNSPSRKKLKIDTFEENQFKFTNGFHLNYIEGIENENQKGYLTLESIITKIKPIKSLFFACNVDDRFIRNCFSGYKDGLKNVSIITGYIGGLPPTNEQQGFYDNLFNHYTVPLDRLSYHNCKFCIFFDKNDKPYIVIITGDLLDDAWKNFTQCLYYAESTLNDNLKYKAEYDNFKLDLIHFLRVGYEDEVFYKELIGPILKILSKWSFEHIKDRLIYSVPGIKENIDCFSYFKVRYLLKENISFFRIKTIIVQCRNIGKITSNKSISWLQNEFLRNFSNNYLHDTCEIKIVYPSVKNIENSQTGLKGGRLFQYKSTIHEHQRWIKKFFYTWKANKICRTPFLSLIGSVTTFDRYMKPVYQIIGSQNLSRISWGEPYGSKFECRNYELGVITFDKDSMVFPYDLPLTKYKKNDTIWQMDVPHE
uniref:Uncharacterized protein n=1 Tax=Parastrongyloides trichosuri TaxID=131310 RepID=A0A0N4ZMF4_PARTI